MIMLRKENPKIDCHEYGVKEVDLNTFPEQYLMLVTDSSVDNFEWISRDNRDYDEFCIDEWTKIYDECHKNTKIRLNQYFCTVSKLPQIIIKIVVGCCI